MESMLGRKGFAPKLFYQVSLEEQVPRDHLLRRVAAAVDFTFVRRLTARFYSHTGQPGIDPAVLFKMSLIGYLYGITSERRLAEEARLHLAYRWFLGYDLDETPPDHSVLSKARARFGVTVYQAFFSEVVRQCERAGLIRGDLLYVDSTLVEANASLQSLGARSLVAQLPDAAEYLASVWQANGEDAAAPAPGAPTPGQTDAAPLAAERANETEPGLETPPTGPPAHAALHVAGPADVPNGRPGAVNDLVVSRTDPDAGLVKREGVPFGLYHKAHVGVDGGRARIITVVDITSGEVADEHLLTRLISEHEGTTGHTVEEVVADTKYGTHENYTRLEGQGIRASIPPHSTTQDRGAYSTDRFVYDLATDRYRCPTGQMLTRQGSSRTAGASGGLIYRGRPKVCGACPVKEACCGTAQARTLLRPDDGGLRERTVAYLRTRRARRHLRRRSVWVEPANAELKERHGLRRAQRRGRDQVLIQALGAALAYNVKKLARARRPDVAEPGAAAVGPAQAPISPPLGSPQGRPPICHRRKATATRASRPRRSSRWPRCNQPSPRARGPQG
jgi:transposase